MSRLNDEQLEHVIESLNEIDFGSIIITVHEGKITQIDTTEKKRFPMKPERQLSYATKN